MLACRTGYSLQTTVHVKSAADNSFCDLSRGNILVLENQSTH